MKLIHKTRPSVSFFFINCFFSLSICFFPLSSIAKYEEIVKVEQVVDQLLNNLVETSSSHQNKEQKNSTLAEILQRDCDMPTIARNILEQEHWNQADPTQRVDFIQAFTGYFARKLRPNLSDLDEYETRVGEVQVAEGYYVVPYYLQKGKTRKNIRWKVSNSNEEFSFKIIDLSLNGLSLTDHEREKIQKLLEKHEGDLDKVIQYLDSKGKIEQTLLKPGKDSTGTQRLYT